MFNEKQLEQYRSITAPQALKERVMAQEDKSNKIISFPRKVLSVAACIAVVGVSVIMLGGTDVSVSLSPAVTASMNKSTENVFELDVESKGNVLLSVSDGVLRVKGSADSAGRLEISSDTQVEWVVRNEGSYVLTAKKGIKTVQYSLSYNEQNENWELAEVR